MTDTAVKKEGVMQSSLRLVIMVVKAVPFLAGLQLLLSISMGVLPAAAALIWQSILSAIQDTIPQEETIGIFIALIIVGGLSSSFPYFTEIFDTILRNKISIKLQKLVHIKADNIPVANYETPLLADMMNRASKMFCYGDAIGFVLSVFGIIKLIVSLSAIAILVWTFEPLLTAGAALLFFPIFIKHWLNKSRISLELQLEPVRREANVFKKYLTNRAYIKDVRMMNIENYMLKKWEHSFSFALSEELKLAKKITLINIFSDLLERGAILGSYTMCVYLVFTDRLTIAEFGAVIVLVGQFTRSTSNIIESISGLGKIMLTVQNTIGYFDLKHEQRNNTMPTVSSISIKNVSYSYPGSGALVLQNINFDMQAGETLVIVGKNGSGKSTLVKLVLGLLNPVTGKIEIDGIPTDSIPYHELHNTATSMFQDYVQYALNIKNNIVISDTSRHHADETIYRLLHSLGIHFVNENSIINLKTDLGIEYGGIDLSGGQWQQLAIARAAIREAKIVILDEPTSALDPLRETELYDNFKELCNGKIGIIVTHRMGMCKFANKIMVMQNGNMHEYGTHKELLAKQGVYAHMYSSQQQMYGGHI